MNEYDDIELQLDEENALTFEVKIEGDASGSPIFRLVCEGKSGLAYSFSGNSSDEGVRFVVPAMTGKIAEGLYDAHLEVIIENKLLIPMHFKTKFLPATKAVVGAVKVENSKKQSQSITAEAKLVSSHNVASHEEKNEGKKETQATKKPMTLKELYALKKAR
jgi:hypothetical protein